MLDPITISAAGASLGFIGLRNAFKRAAINKACAQALPDIEKFEADNVFVRPLSEEFKATTTVMYTTLDKSRQARDKILDTIKELKLPNSNIPMDLPELEQVMRNNRNLFLKTLGISYGVKVEHLFLDQVRQRFKMVKEAAAQNSAKIASGTAHTADDMAAHYKIISEHTPAQLDAFEQDIVKFLDDLGVIDGSVDLLNKIDHFLLDHVGSAGNIDILADKVSSLHAIPGVFSGMYSIGREIKMLSNDETSLGDVFGSGSIPIFFKSLGIKIGMTLDAMTGGMSMGAFTFLGRWLGKEVANEVLEDKNRSLRLELEKIKREIENYYRQTLRAINQAANTFQEEFSKRLEECPDINDEDIIKNFFDELKDNYGEGLRQAEQKLTENTNLAISQIPQNTWRENVLFIDRRKSIEKLYLEAQRKITSRHIGLVHNFSLACEDHVANGADFLVHNVIFDTPETLDTLKRIEEVTEQSAANYSADLTKWENDAIAQHKKGSEHVAGVIKVEGKAYKDFVNSRKPIMNSIARKINANHRRQGKKPAPTAA